MQSTYVQWSRTTTQLHTAVNLREDLILPSAICSAVQTAEATDVGGDPSEFNYRQCKRVEMKGAGQRGGYSSALYAILTGEQKEKVGAARNRFAYSRAMIMIRMYAVE